MLRTIVALLVIAIGLILINGIFHFAWLITVAKICIVLVIILIVLQILSFLFGG